MPSETNQELIMAQGGISLLSVTATNAEDPQTLRMVAGAIANLCGNGKWLDLNSIFVGIYVSEPYLFKAVNYNIS